MPSAPNNHISTLNNHALRTLQSYPHAEQACSHAKQPYRHTEQSCAYAKQPCPHIKQSCVHAKQSHRHTKQSCTLHITIISPHRTIMVYTSNNYTFTHYNYIPSAWNYISTKYHIVSKLICVDTFLTFSVSIQHSMLKADMKHISS